MPDLQSLILTSSGMFADIQPDLKDVADRYAFPKHDRPEGGLAKWGEAE
jgi:hypothetical protein